MESSEILRIAQRWLRNPPSPREYSNGALQGEVAAVMHFAKERAQDDVDAAKEGENESRRT